MYILRNISLLISICMAFSISCKSEGPLTPEQAFEELRNAYHNKDAASVVSLLSKGSVDKVKSIITMISSMNEVQLKSLSERLGATVDEMKKLEVKDYMALQLNAGEKIGDDMMKDILKHKIIGVDIVKERSVVRLENGMELDFVKEGPYWKFNMQEL